MSTGKSSRPFPDRLPAEADVRLGRPKSNLSGTRTIMPRWLSVALLVAVPCLLALSAYDSVAILLFKRGEYPLFPAHDLARWALQDVGLATLYAITVTPRVAPVVADYPNNTR